MILVALAVKVCGSFLVLLLPITFEHVLLWDCPRNQKAAGLISPPPLARLRPSLHVTTTQRPSPRSDP